MIDRDYRIVMGNRAYLKHWAADGRQVVGRLVSEILDKQAFENFGEARSWMSVCAGALLSMK